MTTDWKEAQGIKEFVRSKYEIADKNRMTSRLFDNMGLDAWMTFELMGAAINRVIQNDPFKGAKLMSTKRDVWSSTTANVLELHNKSVDHFYNFQSIKLDGGEGLFRHRNRPDGMFQMEIETGTSSQQMVLFYEGDKHAKDANKTLDKGCRNSHKIYQYFAQSQSYNPDMSACVIIASIDRAAEDFVTFLIDLFKAHMFAFAVIAHYNMTSDKKKTCLHKLLGLGDDFMYDFVVGINVGLTSDNVAFETNFFDDRMDKLKNFNNYNAVSITIRDVMKTEVSMFKAKIDIGLVRIVFIAVPRTAKEMIQIQNPIAPFLIYPLHVQHLVNWVKNGRQKARAQVQTSTLLPFFQCNNLPGICNFRKNMMDVTNVVQVPNPGLDDKRVCSFDETNGFFFIALPLAYYTIQQFEVVNGYLQYNWNDKFKNFDDVFDDMKDTFFDLNNTKIKVKMFSDNKSLFHQICESIDDSTDDIDEDLKMFLQESCRWKEVNKFSPVIFFRTMGIFSLQNAIDFAFEIQRTESKTYLSMLSSYPIGTQILIRQCMHKLTDVTAFAYLARDASKTVSTLQDDESSEDEEDANVLVKFLLGMKNIVSKFIKSIGWNVDFGTGFTEKDAASIGNDLVRLYLETISEWTFVSNDTLDRNTSTIVDDSNGTFVAEFKNKNRNSSEKLKISKFPITGPDMIVKFHCDNQDYHYKPVFPVTFMCSDEVVINKIKMVTDQSEVNRVTVVWGGKNITFKRASEEQLQAIMDAANKGKKSLREMVFGR
jgi:hypothetical protein